MEPTTQTAPPVVAVVVASAADDLDGPPRVAPVPDDSDPGHRSGPGPWFDEALRSIARQDYANLRTLVLVTGEPGDIPERVKEAIPNAFVRQVAGAPGFGAAANEVLHLVEGDNGFFCFLHDDVALDADAIRLLVEELYRSNAGIVGPKLVDWERPSELQHVGFGLDRFGELDPVVEPGETDQEQHDAVRDVFALPSACLLVRADLFRILGGFDEAIEFHGDDVDLCWRAHLSGARVVVAPAARARHRERLEQRRPDLAHEVLRARHRVRTVATLSGGRRLPLLSAQIALATVVQFVVSAFTGHLGRGWAGIRALMSAVVSTPSLLVRRRRIAPLRIVPDREVAGLQMRGSARLTSYLRSRDVRPASARSSQRAWRDRSGAAASIGLGALVLGLLVGGRRLLLDGVPRVGELLPFGDSPRDLVSAAWSTWSPAGLGGPGASSPGLGLIGVAGTVSFARMGMLHTVALLATLAAGAIGTWRLTSAFPRTRARVATSASYLLLPLATQALSLGRWSALAVFAGLPWVLDSVRRASGIEAASPTLEATGVAEVDETPDWSTTARLVAAGGLAAAIATAFAPTFPVVVAMVAMVLIGAGLVVGVAPVATLRTIGATAAVLVVGVLANASWWFAAIGSGWSNLVGVRAAGDRGDDVVALMSFDIGNGPLAVLSLAALLPVLVSVAVSRGWRFAWAVRGAALVIVFGFVAVLDDSDSFLWSMPGPAVTLVPVALGAALCAGATVAAFEHDVKGGSFGWRQPATIVAMVAIGVAAVPGVASMGSGRFDLPVTTMLDLLPLADEAGSSDQGEFGEYRVLWVGDASVLPVSGHSFRPGVAYAVTSGPSLEVTDAFVPTVAADDPGVADVAAALEAISGGSTARAGRLLAPWAIRYVVVPVVDGAVSTDVAPVPVPAGLLDALGDQLDLAEIYGPPNTVVFENSAWVPIRSVLDAEGDTASRDATVGSLARADLGGARPVLVGTPPTHGSATLPGDGPLHLATPFDSAWVVDTDRGRASVRPAFGRTLAADLPADATTVTVHGPSSMPLRIVLVAQLAVWVAAFAVAAGALGGVVRRRRPVVRSTIDATTDPLITLPVVSVLPVAPVSIDPNPTPATGVALGDLALDPVDPVDLVEPAGHLDQSAGDSLGGNAEMDDTGEVAT